MLEHLKTNRMNKLLEMASNHDQLRKHGLVYMPDDRDLKLIDKLDAEILSVVNDRGI